MSLFYVFIYLFFSSENPDIWISQWVLWASNRLLVTNQQLSKRIIQPTIIISNLLFVELFVGRDAQIGRREERVTEMERVR